MGNSDGGLGYVHGSSHKTAMRNVPNYLKNSKGFKMSKRAGYVIPANKSIYSVKGFIKKRR
jgi:hypothetical protein